MKNKVVADLDMSENEQLVLFNDNSEKRRLFENCTAKGVRAINPLIYWSDKELWEFIKQYDIPYCKLYDQGFDRLGCIGCPMAGKNRYKEFEAYPNFKRYYLKAFEKMLKKREELGKQTRHQTAQDVFDWWMENEQQEETEFENFKFI